MAQVVIDRKVKHFPDGKLSKQGMRKLVLVEIVLLPLPGDENKLAARLCPFLQQTSLLIFSIANRTFLLGKITPRGLSTSGDLLAVPLA